MFHIQLHDDDQSRASPKDQVSMPFIKRHIRRRLTNAKDTCDKELRKVIDSITQHVELRLRDAGHSQDTPPLDSPNNLQSTHAHSHSFSSDVTVDDTMVDDQEYALDMQIPEGHSRRVSMTASASSSPNSLRRHPHLPKSQGELSPGKKLSQTSTTPSSSSASYAQSGISRRLSRNMHIPIMPTRSGENSRSNSRSRSPLPPSAAEMVSSPRSSSTINRRLSRFDLDAAAAQLSPDLFMATLHDVIGIATDIIDTPISKLIIEPRLCAEFVQKVQKVGRAWDEHLDWQGRGWYVQLLLAVAGLSRVVEWWEAEKQFWNFEEDDDHEIEPLTFVVKPEEAHTQKKFREIDVDGDEFCLASEEDGSGSVSTMENLSHHERGRKLSQSSFSGIGATDALPAPSDDGPQPLISDLHSSIADSQSRRSSKERVTEITPEPTGETKPSPEELNSSPEASRVQATEKLRIQAEEAQSINIVMEIGLDREEVLWVNQAWTDVIGTTWEDISGMSISSLLHPEDSQVFKDATRQLQQDDSHTIEAQFRLRIEPPSSEDETASTASNSSVPKPRSPLATPSPLSLLSSLSSPSFSDTTNTRGHPLSASLSLPAISTDIPPSLRQKPLYRIFEGKGMLMLDRITGNPIHSMWVIKPISPPGHFDPEDTIMESSKLGDFPHGALSPGPGFHRRVSTDPITPFIISRPISSAPILCRICECGVPEWFFEKHNETCNEVHRLEAAIGECNESIGELRNTIRDLLSTLDREKERGFTNTGSSSSINSLQMVPEYRGMSIATPRSAPSSPSMLGLGSSLHIFRPPLGRKKKKLQGIRQLQRSLLEQLEEALCLAFEISIPAVKEDQRDQPMERQRLLSPASVDKFELLKHWRRPLTAPTEEDDPALARLVLDVQLLLKAKLESVNRMENTVRYSEKIRQEWEARYEEALNNLEMEMEMEMEMEDVPEEDEGEDGGDENASHSSTKSEYAFDGNDEAGTSNRSSLDPTPMSCSPMPALVRTRSGRAVEASPTPMPALSSPQPFSHSSGVCTPSPIPLASTAVPATYQGVGIHHAHTRSSTPSSISSPLALAAPINAPPAPESILFLPSAQAPSLPVSTPAQITPPSLPAPGVESSAQTIRARRSAQNINAFDPKLLVTPPLSPLVSPRDITTVTSGHSRRQSVMNPIISPTGSSIPAGPLSPRIPSIAPSSRTTPSSIKDFDIIKPISKGAFGSVFLAKKKTTGDYYAIKVLKKADMIAKNQITNVKAERMILMRQAESPFVVKLYFTFQSKDNLYLVMEYLNGGDCAALIKSLGSLPEEWTKAYVAEVVLGLEYLHQRDVVHRDLKPDNLLIDQHGHLKLTDFGLSRIGLLGRQARDRSVAGSSLERVGSLERGQKRQSSVSRQASMDSYVASPVMSEVGTPGSYFGHRPIPSAHANLSTDDVSESSGSESLGGYLWSKTPGGKNFESPLQSFASELTNDLRSHSHSSSGTPPGEKRFVGTPDYLAPESILGISEVDRAVDWWALGVITYEFLYGIPPFHDETPEKVFENIISRKIDWHEDWVDFSKELMDFMDQLLQTDPKKRLGWKGADEVKAHPFLADVDWESVTTTEAQFVPQVTDPESTDYFDPRGAIPHLFQDDESIAVAGRPGDSPIEMSSSLAREVSLPSTDDFGSFNFKNLPVLKQINDDVIRRLKTEQMVPMTQALSDPVSLHRRRSVSVRKPQNVLTANIDPRILTNPPSPSTSTSSIASSPSRISLPPSTPGSASSHNRRPSEYGPVERFKQNHFDNDGSRRNSLPSRLRTSSMSSMEQEGQVQDHWRQVGTPPSSVVSVDLKKPDEATIPKPPPEKTERSDRAVTCLIAEDNPISVKIMETLLTRLGCRCVLVHDGAEAISVALGEIKFDVILMDHHMPIMDGETAAKYIKNTNNKNKNTPIISVSAYAPQEASMNANLFAASLAKPVQKGDIVAVMRQLGFKMVEGPKGKVAR